MTWRDLPKLNLHGYERHRGRPLEDVLEDFKNSYSEVFKLIEGMSEEEIFTNGFYS
jgi:hypothetical protein